MSDYFDRKWMKTKTNFTVSKTYVHRVTNLRNIWYILIWDIERVRHLFKSEIQDND
jgi:hypothetical protein